MPIGIVNSRRITALAGIYAFKSLFWALPGLRLTRSTAAISIATINSIGNIGGFAGPYAIGYLRDRIGSPFGSLLFLSGLLFLSFSMTWLERISNTPQEHTDAAEVYA